MDESVVVCAWALHVLHYGPDKDPGTLGGHEGTKWHSAWHKGGHRCPLPPPNGGRGAHVVHVIILLMTVWCMLGEQIGLYDDCLMEWEQATGCLGLPFATILFHTLMHHR